MTDIFRKKKWAIVNHIFFAFILLYPPTLFADEISTKRLNDFAEQMLQKRAVTVGYPGNQNTDLKEFYEWYINSKLYEVTMNNVGDSNCICPSLAFKTTLPSR